MWRSRQVFSKLRAFVFRGASERSLAKEVAAHLAMIEDDLRNRGLSAEEAKYAARRSFGPVEQAKEQYRDQRAFIFIEQLFQDVRHGTRSLAKSPGFTLVAVLSLAFGIGVNTAIFTLVNGILLKQLPISDANRVVQLKAYGKTWSSGGLSYPQFHELQRQTSIFSDVIAFSGNRAVLDADGDSHQVDVQLVTGNYFSFFRAEPALGRLLNAEDDRIENGSPVCVLSYQAWRSRFGADPRVLGRIVRLDNHPFEIIGVAGPDFAGAELQIRNDIWVPSAMSLALMWDERGNPHAVWLSTFAKLRDGVALPQANVRLKAISKGINDALPKNRANADAAFEVVDGRKGADTLRTTFREPLVVLMGAVTIFLLIACANVTNLLLARGTERAQEFSVKLSLGISRGRLMRQLLVESALLALAGAALAIVAGRTLVIALLSLLKAGGHWGVMTVSMDPAVLVFTLGLSAFTMLVVGVYPAFSAIRTDMTPVLKGGSGTRAPKSLARRGLIVAQISLTVVLVFGANLFSHSLRKLHTIDLGYDIDHVAVIRIDYRGKEGLSGSQALNDILNRARHIPGVGSADLANPSMLSGASMTSEVGASAASKNGAPRQSENTYFVFTSPQYFATMRIPLLRGRDFSEHDRKRSQPVAIINELLSHILWPGEDPLGKQMIGGWNRENPIVVGVVGNSKYGNVRETLKPIVYEPIDQMATMTASLQVRSQMPLAAIERQVRKLVAATAPGYQVAEVSSMELLRDKIISQDRLLTFLSVLFGALGTTLAFVGLYGLISYTVTRRTREIGIRISVGAQRHQILVLFLREVLLLAGIGVTVGLPLALLLSKPLHSFLYEITPADPFGIVSTLVLIASGSIAASILPASRATQVDPMEALRYE